MTFFNEELKELEIMMKTIPRYRCMSDEKKEIIGNLCRKRIFRDNRHKDRFMYAVCTHKPMSNNLNSLLASLYILASSKTLWKRSENCVYCNNIDFDNIIVKDTCLNDYCLLKAAQDLHTNSMHFSIGELASPTVIPDEILKVIVNAIKIKRGKF